MSGARLVTSVCCSKGLPSSPAGHTVEFTYGPAWQCPTCGGIWLWDDASGWEWDPEQDRA